MSGLPDDDFVEFRPPPSIDDRLWRHPAELALAGQNRAPVAPPRARRSPWAVGLVSVVGSAVIAGTLMFSAGGMGDEAPRLGLRPLATLVPRTGDGAASGIVNVEVLTNDGPREASGIVLTDGHHILTSLRVAPDGDSVVDLRIVDTSGNTHDGHVVARDALNDLAIVQVSDVELTPRTIGATAALQDGQAVRAFGGGFGAGLREWTNNVTELDVSVHDDTVDLVGAARLAVPLPAQAAGAVVLDADGALVGMVSLERPDAGSAASTLAAVVIPVARIQDAIDQFLRTGAITHAWLGVESTNVTSVAQNVAYRSGALVEAIVSDSPASSAGIEPGDILLRLCNERVASIDDVVDTLLRAVPGQRCTVEVARGAELWRTEVTVGERTAA